MIKNDTTKQPALQDKQKPDLNKNLLSYQDESKDETQEYYDEEEEEFEDEVQEIEGSEKVQNPDSASKNRSSPVQKKAEIEEEKMTESNYDPQQDETMKILIPNTKRMDDIIDGMGIERKTRFAGYLGDYIENNIERYASTSGTKPSLFDVAREKDTDRGLKI